LLLFFEIIILPIVVIIDCITITPLTIAYMIFS